MLSPTFQVWLELTSEKVSQWQMLQHTLPNHEGCRKKFYNIDSRSKWNSKKFATRTKSSPGKSATSFPKMSAMSVPSPTMSSATQHPLQCCDTPVMLSLLNALKKLSSIQFIKLFIFVTNPLKNDRLYTFVFMNVCNKLVFASFKPSCVTYLAVSPL